MADELDKIINYTVDFLNKNRLVDMAWQLKVAQQEDRRGNSGVAIMVLEKIRGSLSQRRLEQLKDGISQMDNMNTKHDGGYKRRRTNKRKVSRRKSSRRKATKRKSNKRKVTKHKVTKRKSKRNNTKRRSR